MPIPIIMYLAYGILPKATNNGSVAIGNTIKASGVWIRKNSTISEAIHMNSPIHINSVLLPQATCQIPTQDYKY